MSENEIQKLRRFSLLIGVILTVYSLAGVELVSPAVISPLGVPLKIRYPWLLGFGLLIGSVYGLVRYWYYAVLLGTSPRKARQRLKQNRLPNGSKVSTEQSISPTYMDADTCKDVVSNEVEKYFPVLPNEEKTRVEVFQDGRFYRFEIKTKGSVNLLGAIYDIDYFAPVWLNLIALLIYVFRLFGCF
jgi:hypothetical protein